MTDHEALLGQARDVLMQHKSVPAVYRDPDGVGAACRIILSRPDTTRSAGGQTQAATVGDRMTGEVPVAPADGGLARVDTAGRFEIDGVAWGIESTPAGLPGWHCVNLVRTQQLAHGRGRHG